MKQSLHSENQKSRFLLEMGNWEFREGAGGFAVSSEKRITAQIFSRLIIFSLLAIFADIGIFQVISI